MKTLNPIPPTLVKTSATLGIVNTLRLCPLFKSLNEDSLNQLAADCRSIKLEKGGTLFREGEKAHGFYVVQSGLISLSRINNEGKEQIISLFRPCNVFAEAILSSLETFPANATALETSQVILVSRNAFRIFVGKNPELAMSMLASMSIHLKHLLQMIEDLKFKQIECRLASWLLRQSENSDNVIHLQHSKKILASRLGVTSETLSRAFARFRNESLITVEAGRITLLDRSGIEHYLKS